MEENLERIGHAMMQAWVRVKKSQARMWGEWMTIGEGLLEGRTWAMKISGVNRPEGRGYVTAYAEWLRRWKVDDMDKSDRAKLLQLMEERPSVEQWRATLTDHDRRNLNNPVIVWRKWTAATRIKHPKPRIAGASASEMGRARATIEQHQERGQELEQELEQARARIAELESGNITLLTFDDLRHRLSPLLLGLPIDERKVAIRQIISEAGMNIRDFVIEITIGKKAPSPQGHRHSARAEPVAPQQNKEWWLSAWERSEHMQTPETAATNEMPHDPAPEVKPAMHAGDHATTPPADMDMEPVAMANPKQEMRAEAMEADAIWPIPLVEWPPGVMPERIDWKSPMDVPKRQRSPVQQEWVEGNQQGRKDVKNAHYSEFKQISEAFACKDDMRSALRSHVGYHFGDKGGIDKVSDGYLTGWLTAVHDYWAKLQEGEKRIYLRRDQNRYRSPPPPRGRPHPSK